VPERSQVWIEARSSLHPIHSRTDGLEGFVEMELGSDGDVILATLPAAQLSLPASRLRSGNSLQDRELYKRIDARRYPTIDGVLDDVEPSGTDGSYQVAGDVTFRGVTRRCRDEMHIHALDNQTIQLDGSSRFDIRDFGMDPPRMLMLSVQPQVDVRVEIIAVKED
jgi:polyisoprenoid-binding protein YceI